VAHSERSQPFDFYLLLLSHLKKQLLHKLLFGLFSLIGRVCHSYLLTQLFTVAQQPDCSFGELFDIMWGVICVWVLLHHYGIRKLFEVCNCIYRIRQTNWAYYKTHTCNSIFALGYGNFGKLQSC
jgi:hypothetical protein